jgi:hypothetical protein
MTAILFGGYLAMVVAVVMLLTALYLPRRATFQLGTSLAVWLVYVGVLSYCGVVSQMAHWPPGPAFVLLPVIVVVVFLALSNEGARIAQSIPLWALLGTQVFRVGVELLIYKLYVDGFAPRLMTFEGGNIDIFIGASAPLIAWVATTGKLGQHTALIWNFIGLAALGNIAIRALGTTPGVLNFLHVEMPDVAIGMFPFTYLLGFFAPLALVLHIFAIRSIRARSHAVDIE